MIKCATPHCTAPFYTEQERAGEVHSMSRIESIKCTTQQCKQCRVSLSLYTWRHLCVRVFTLLEKNIFTRGDDVITPSLLFTMPTVNSAFSPYLKFLIKGINLPYKFSSNRLLSKFWISWEIITSLWELQLSSCNQKYFVF